MRFREWRVNDPFPRARLRGRPLFLLIVCLAVGSCSPSRTVESLGLLRNLSTDEESDPLPQRVPHRYEVDGRDREADLYLLPPEPHAAIVVVPGAAPQGKDDPRLTAFARDLARADMLVLVPEIPNLRDLQVSARDADAIADAIRHLASQQRASGLVAISYAAGPAMIAALREDVAPHLRFMVLIGGYHDLEAVVRFFTTGYYRRSPDEPWQHREPNAYGKWVFARSNAPRLDDPRDRTLLTELADRKLEDLNAPVDDLAERLSPEGRAVYDLLTNRDAGQVRHLLDALPASVRQELDELDLSRRDLSRTAANVILIHGRDDAIIPATESQSLAEALPPDRVDLFLVSALDHADLGGIGLSDGMTLLRAAYRVLEERDAAARMRPSPANAASSRLTPSARIPASPPTARRCAGSSSGCWN